MRFYFLLNRLPWPRTYLGKILTISFLGVHVPMIGTVVWILLGSGVPLISIWTVLVAMLMATLLGTAATLACIYALLTPVRVATKSISRYLTEKAVPCLPTTGRDEVGVLMGSIQEGITRLDAALDAANAQANEAVRQKREKFQLLSGLSHEFRTPLNHIIGFAEMMTNEALGPLGRPTYKEYAGDIGSSGGELLIALQTVLDLSQAESGQLALDRQDLSLAEALNSVMGLVHLETERAGVELQLTVDHEARVFGDHRLLKQILLHALRGTIGSGGGGHTVTLIGRESGTRCAIEIAHDGPPWLAEDVPAPLVGQMREMKSYSPANAAGHPYASRTALHLALVQSLVGMSDGEIYVAAPPAGGRMIRVVLPAKPRDAWTRSVR